MCSVTAIKNCDALAVCWCCFFGETFFCRLAEGVNDEFKPLKYLSFVTKHRAERVENWLRRKALRDSEKEEKSFLEDMECMKTFCLTILSSFSTSGGRRKSKFYFMLFQPGNCFYFFFGMKQ